ncbi:carboxypeptidase-like regulatory domain-containing protein [Aurantibacter sp.]|uniref:carboxypeptidase-like regulatory domain-containing protein n=1 Tax=Aurantibacter sp. TaxID=2807103 RepID=UPI0035C79E1E
MKTSIPSKCIYFIFSLLLILSINVSAQNTNFFSGKILDKSNSNPLHLATLNVVDSNISTVTNKEGEFNLKLPKTKSYKLLQISFLGYQPLEIELSSLKTSNNTIYLKQAATQLDVVELSRTKNAKDLVLQMLKLKNENYIDKSTVMTSFYRETIKKNNKNASLSEAVLKIQKTPYTTSKQDLITIVKARKKTNYSKLDTLALKLRGGPYSALHTDLIKYPDFIFTDNSYDNYNFTFDKSTTINGKAIYVINFKQKENIADVLYYGKLYIDATTNALTKADYSLNLDNPDKASELFISKKPSKAKVLPTRANYLVNFSSSNGKWHYAYSNISLNFKVKWKSQWFGKKYSLQSEMAITDWEFNNTFKIANKEKLKSSSIFEEKANGFLDDKFWGTYNIIEPEKSIENAIKKINKQLKKS